MPRSHIGKSLAGTLVTQVTATTYMTSRSFASESHVQGCAGDAHGDMASSGVSLTTVKQGFAGRRKSGKRPASAALELSSPAKASKVTADICKLLPAATSCMC